MLYKHVILLIGMLYYFKACYIIYKHVTLFKKVFLNKYKKYRNHKYKWFSHLRLEKLVYKLFCLVPGGRVKVHKRGGGSYFFFSNFALFEKCRIHQKIDDPPPILWIFALPPGTKQKSLYTSFSRRSRQDFFIFLWIYFFYFLEKRVKLKKSWVWRSDFEKW